MRFDKRVQVEIADSKTAEVKNKLTYENVGCVTATNEMLSIIYKDVTEIYDSKYSCVQVSNLFLSGAGESTYVCNYTIE